MRNVIIGTAGHVDHGKTLLIKALTGIDTDRLKEEKKRGITIELGFAHIEFENGARAGIIDVPGHEKFIRNMLAGAGGIDLAMLVVAADEGFMPQTIEHLGILSLLDIKTGVVVITKTDMVDADWISMIHEDIKERVRGTFLENAPVAEVSAYTGAGINELRALLGELVASVGGKNTRGAFRIPVDRVFSVDGFGTVITGTMIEGQLADGDELTIYPSGLAARVRNLQVHGQDVEKAFAGQRVAVNLAGLKKTDISRGDLLAKSDSIHCSPLLDVRLSVLAQSKRVIESDTQLHFYHGSRSLLCKVVLLDSDRLEAGQSGYAQLRLAEEVAVKPGDRFVLRFYSPLETIGGGVILDERPEKHRRGDEALLRSLAVRESGSGGDKVLQAVADAAAGYASFSSMQKTLQLDADEASGELAALLERGEIMLYAPDRYIDRGTLESVGKKLSAALSEHHRANPLQTGMRRDEARQKVFGKLDSALADGIFALLIQDGIIKPVGQRLALVEFEVKYSERQKKIREQLLKSYIDSGFAPLATDELYTQFLPKEKDDCKKVLDALIADESVVSVAPQIIFSSQAYEKARELLLGHFESEPQITLPQFRDLLQTSRKYALALLEHWDRNKFTRKDGDNRELVR